MSYKLRNFIYLSTVAILLGIPVATKADRTNNSSHSYHNKIENFNISTSDFSNKINHEVNHKVNNEISRKLLDRQFAKPTKEPSTKIHLVSVSSPRESYFSHKGADDKAEDDQIKSDMDEFAKERQNYHYDNITKNTRDLGGYYTINGNYRVKPDRLIRSADLQNLTDAGRSDLKKLNTKSIIDLRFQQGKNGIDNRPDPNEMTSSDLSKTNIHYIIDPVYTQKESHSFSPGVKAEGEYYYYGWPATSDPHAIAAYKKVFHAALNNQHGAILYHCNLGRDRTGTTSALLLSALGIKRSTIFKDYLLTYYYDHDEHDMSRRKSELANFFDTIDKDYGSVSNYLHSEIGLNRSDIAKLRHEYLEPVRKEHRQLVSNAYKHPNLTKLSKRVNSRYVSHTDRATKHDRHNKHADKHTNKHAHTMTIRKIKKNIKLLSAKVNRINNRKEHHKADDLIKSSAKRWISRK